MTKAIIRTFDLRHSQLDPEAIHDAISNGVRFGGISLWLLIFAILIASVGLNVNSTAAIIGAMLISPLMGPIVGIGYAAAVNDFELVKKALRSLAMFVAISLVTAAAYFAMSPLKEPGTELLARTTPTLWDIIIAFCGGCGGILAITRRDSSTVMPGVAIATALMPPLCTAGYGIAAGNPGYLLGALYLFAINSVFIAFATLVFAKVMRLPERAQAAVGTRKRTRNVFALAVVLTIAPGVYLTYSLLQQELFQRTVKRLVSELEASDRLVILASRIEGGKRSVELTVGGDRRPSDLADDFTRRLAAEGISGAHVRVRYSGTERVDVASLTQELRQGLLESTLKQLDERQGQIERLSKQLQGQGALRDTLRAAKAELHALYPNAKLIALGTGSLYGTAFDDADGSVVLVLQTAAGDPPVDRSQLTAWLRARFGQQNVVVETSEQPAPDAEEPKAGSENGRKSPAAGQPAHKKAALSHR